MSDRVGISTFLFDAFVEERALDSDVLFLCFCDLLEERADERRDLLTHCSERGALIDASNLFIKQLFAAHFFVCKKLRQRSL